MEQIICPVLTLYTSDLQELSLLICKLGILIINLTFQKSSKYQVIFCLKIYKIDTPQNLVPHLLCTGRQVPHFFSLKFFRHFVFHSLIKFGETNPGTAILLKDVLCQDKASNVVSDGLGLHFGKKLCNDIMILLLMGRSQ